jgi:hypothetical protein
VAVALWLDDPRGCGLSRFYVLLTPIWLGLRALAWLAEWRSRRSKAK